jgi:hypothetical protein
VAYTEVQVYEAKNTAVSTGVLHLFVPDFGVGGYGYVVATRGTPDASVTFGGGMLYGRDGDDGAAIPMFTIGGEHRIGRRTKFVTENYIFQGGAIVTAARGSSDRRRHSKRARSFRLSIKVPCPVSSLILSFTADQDGEQGSG